MSDSSPSHHLLTQSDEYALRAMTWLAAQPGGELIPGSTIAEATGVPPHFVSKVLRKLVVAGLLTSTRGRAGGFRLALPPDCIRFLDVLLATDFKPDNTHCAFGWPKCNPSEPCPLHPAFASLQTIFLQWASSNTLQDVLDNEGSLERMLSSSTPLDDA